jgi:hypothetical protein
MLHLRIWVYSESSEIRQGFTQSTVKKDLEGNLHQLSKSQSMVEPGGSTEGSAVYQELNS